MTARADRHGFTLLETMVASSIALIVMLALVVMFLFCHRMFRIAMAESESALAMRELRDKLLFRAGPGLSSGLLTGKASADAAAITMTWQTLDQDAANDKPDRIRIVSPARIRRNAFVISSLFRLSINSVSSIFCAWS